MPMYPFITMNPKVRFGRPTLRGTGLTTYNMWCRWTAGETVESIAEDYKLDPLLIHVAVAFELGRSRSKAAREALEP